MNVEAYLRRLAIDRPPRPDASSLRALHAAHPHRIPFENLSIHLGEPISLEIDALAEKILGRHRGGFCFELNGLFAELLIALGYRVTLLAAMVWDDERSLRELSSTIPAAASGSTRPPAATSTSSGTASSNTGSSPTRESWHQRDADADLHKH